MRGKLIIIEAGDGCGKATQAKALFERLKRDGENVYQVEFPDYQSDSSALIKMYLGGKFGSHADDVNAYTASTFYAVDRYASYQSKWKAWHEAGGIIISDRYTTSNMVHQAVKISDQTERDQFLAWLWDLEFVKMGLPVPDAVVFLDMDPVVSDRLITKRAVAMHMAKDIHEQDRNYLARCHDAYCALARKYGWKRISCVEGGELKEIGQIHEEIYQVLRPIFARDNPGCS